MCRIAGIVNPQLSVEEIKDRISAMCYLQKHGGPDDEGIWVSPETHVGMGHRRLSLIDLSPGGHQPMFYKDNLVITYNGELYNYRELKLELTQLGFQFITSSDTEVILAAFEAWGIKAFQRFNGMFAFGLYNRKEGKFYLVRDAVGIKPLYYAMEKDSVVFASEVRAFSAHPNLTQAREDWPVYMMAYGHLPEPITTLHNVRPLRKGHFLEYTIVTGKVMIESFHHFSYIEKISQPGEIIDAIRSQLSKAVERHLLADAPIGAFMSGGIDSSLLSLIAGSFVNEKLNTLSIYFAEGHYSEKQYQDIVAAKLKGNHRAYQLNKIDYETHLPDIIDAMDLPSSDGINTWFISKYAKEFGLKAVLSGLGGDELFGGYPSFERLRTATLLQQIPNAALRAGRYSHIKKLRRLVYLSLPGIKGKYLFLRGQFIPSEIARHLDIEEKQVWRILEEQPELPSIHHLTHKNQASWMELNLYMQNQLLRDSDVMSMAHGIEIRVPFLDKDFITLALSIMSDVKYAKAGKGLLIDAFKDILPREVYDRPKMGFAFPFREWMANNAWVKDQLLTAGKEEVKIYELFLSNKCHWSQLLTALLARNYTVEKSSLTYA